MDKAIIVENVSKKYTLYDNAKDRFLDLFNSKSRGESFYALKDVDFEAEHGEVVGFIGINGSGKSTLSNIIAGIVPETTGKVTVDGQASLIAVAAGLKNDLTGRDNIELKLLMLGFNKDEIKALEDDIIEFSELGQFIDQPVKSYSSGMKSRLGFSISVNVDPDILIIDEALSVGDRAFAEKSLNKMNEFKEQGKTMIFVSHSLGQMKKFCDTILWLEYGKVKAYGDVDEIMPRYQEFLDMWKQLTKEEREDYRNKAISGTLNYDQYLTVMESKVKEDYNVRLVSKIARLRSKDSYIYRNPCDSKPEKSSDTYKNSSYYIKKETIFNDENFYLISTKPSATNGTIGWMKEKDINARNLLNIDEDYKEFIIAKNGATYNRPWGKDGNLIIDDIEEFIGQKFYVEQTIRFGKQVWYYGQLNDKRMWIQDKFLRSINHS